MRHSALTAVASLAALALAVPALGQTIDELTITGHALRNRPQSLSETVSYADLDLTVAGNRDILSRRISAAAGRVCDRLDEPRPSAGNLGHSCQEVAERGAMGQMRLAVANARSGPAYAAASYGAQASAVVPTTVAASPAETPKARTHRRHRHAAHAARKTASTV